MLARTGRGGRSATRISASQMLKSDVQMMQLGTYPPVSLDRLSLFISGRCFNRIALGHWVLISH